MSQERDNLRRLQPRAYRELQAVHWTMTINHRRTGWLDDAFHLRFREAMVHALFRYGLCCPVYCCMPDHIHLLWNGLLESSDQLLAIKHFRKHVNGLLHEGGFELQKQAYDHVLREDERETSAFESTAGYIARNPVRAGLISDERYHEYPYTGRVVPGYPELNRCTPESWSAFWRAYYYLRDGKMFRG